MVALLGLAVAPLARAADPLPATEIAQDVSLAEGAQAGVVHLKSKGGFGGDVAAVDVDGARIPNKPVTVRVRIEFWGADKGGTPWPLEKAGEIAAQIEGRLGALTGSDGTPVTIDVIPSVRAADAPATPGFHQIQLQDVPVDSIPNTVNNDATPPSGARTGEWSSNAGATTYAHETVHLLGFSDRYQGLKPDLLVDGKRYPLPQFKGDKSNKAALDDWFKKVLAAEDKLEAKLGKPGKLVPGIPPGHEDDILANTQTDTSKILTSDVDAIIARAGVHLAAKPGDVIANKDGSEQNLGVGAPVDLFAAKGGNAHADGLYAYCIDLHRHIPARDKGFDVLGQAKDLNIAQMTALQKVLEEIGRRQDPASLRSPPGAQSAVWAVTDGEEPTPEGKAILDAAGVAFDQQSFSQTPHFNDPNSGAPNTAAITPGGVVPGITPDRSPAPTDPIGGPDDTATTATGRVLAARVRLGRSQRRLRLTLAIDAPSETVLVSLQRRGRGKVKPLTTLGVVGGVEQTTLKLPKLAKGKHRLLLQGAGGWTRKLSFKIGAKKR